MRLGYSLCQTFFLLTCCLRVFRTKWTTNLKCFYFFRYSTFQFSYIFPVLIFSSTVLVHSSSTFKEEIISLGGQSSDFQILQTQFIFVVNSKNCFKWSCREALSWPSRIKLYQQLFQTFAKKTTSICRKFVFKEWMVILQCLTNRMASVLTFKIAPRFRFMFFAEIIG